MNSAPIRLILDAIPVAVAIIPAITLHEAAHGYAALALGDDTARRMGRLSLNPLRHVDRVGTILLPGLLIVSQLLTLGRIQFLFGWAKPVPIDARRFPDPLRGMMWVAMAGPAMNFFLAWLAALANYALPYLPGFTLSFVDPFLQLFFLANLVLGLFNLLPVLPLDGGRIVAGLLPRPLALAFSRTERYGIPLVLVLLFVVPAVLRAAGVGFDPIQSVLGTLLPMVGRFILALAGQHG